MYGSIYPAPRHRFRGVHAWVALPPPNCSGAPGRWCVARACATRTPGRSVASPFRSQSGNRKSRARRPLPAVRLVGFIVYSVGGAPSTTLIYWVLCNLQAITIFFGFCSEWNAILLPISHSKMCLYIFSSKVLSCNVCMRSLFSWKTKVTTAHKVAKPSFPPFHSSKPQLYK